MSVKAFNEKLKCLRIKKGYSQEELAKRLSISRQSISKWELGISMPDISYLVPLSKNLNIGLEELLNAKDGNHNDKVNYENYKIVVRKNISRLEYEELKVLYNDNSYIERTINLLNKYYGKDFYIVGKLNNKIISCCYIIAHPETTDFYHITDFKVLKKYQKKGYGTRLIDSVISILTDFGAINISAFLENTSIDIFKRFGFEENKQITIFGNNSKSVSPIYNCPYFELLINHDYYLDNITADSSLIIERMMKYYNNKYQFNFSQIFKQNIRSYSHYLLSLNTKNNEQAFIIMNGKITCGCAYMFYQDYDYEGQCDHSVYLYILLGENHLHLAAIKIAVEKSKEFYYLNQRIHKLDCIKCLVNEDNVIKDQLHFYRKCLSDCGFKTDDNILYYIK